MTFIKRADLGRPLTWDELDSNFEQVDSYAAAASASASAAQTQAQSASQSAQQALQYQQAAETAAASAEGAVDVLRDEIIDPDGAEKYPDLQLARWRDEGDIRGWGAKNDDNFDNHAAITDAIAWALATGKDLKGEGIFRCSAGLVLPSGRYSMDFTGAKFVFDAGVSVAITIGTAGPSPYRGTIRGLHVEKTNFEGSDIGILLLNCVEYSIENPVVTNFSKAVAAIPGASSRVAYGTIYNPTFTNHEYGFYANPPASSYVNENTIFGGRFASNVNGRLVDQIYLDNATGQGVQHNRFIGVSIEGYNGAGACGRTSINVVNGANQNTFSFCRTEQYGTGWSSGYSATFGPNTSGNLIEDTRIDVTISDASGLNQWDTRLGGIKRVGPSTAVSANPMIQLIRSQPLNNAATKFAIDIQDTYSASGDAGLLKYQSNRGSGNVIEITTFYGDVLKITGEGEFLTAIKTPFVETTSTTALNYFNSRIGTVGTKTLTPATSVTGILAFSNTSSNTGGVAAEFITNNVATRHHISFSNPNGVVGSISTSANATSFNTSSDERLKFEVEDADDSGEIVDSIRVRQFNWKADGSHQDYGFVAQELYKVFPYAVTDGGDDEEAMWSVDYSKLIPLLFKEIQQRRKREKLMDERIKALEGGQ